MSLYGLIPSVASALIKGASDNNQTLKSLRAQVRADPVMALNAIRFVTLEPRASAGVIQGVVASGVGAAGLNLLAQAEQTLSDPRVAEQRYKDLVPGADAALVRRAATSGWDDNKFILRATEPAENLRPIHMQLAMVKAGVDAFSWDTSQELRMSQNSDLFGPQEKPQFNENFRVTPSGEVIYVNADGVDRNRGPLESAPGFRDFAAVAEGVSRPIFAGASAISSDLLTVAGGLIRQVDRRDDVNFADHINNAGDPAIGRYLQAPFSEEINLGFGQPNLGNVVPKERREPGQGFGSTVADTFFVDGDGDIDRDRFRYKAVSFLADVVGETLTNPAEIATLGGGKLFGAAARGAGITTAGSRGDLIARQGMLGVSRMQRQLVPGDQRYLAAAARVWERNPAKTGPIKTKEELQEALAEAFGAVSDDFQQSVLPGKVEALLNDATLAGRLTGMDALDLVNSLSKRSLAKVDQNPEFAASLARLARAETPEAVQNSLAQMLAMGVVDNRTMRGLQGKGSVLPVSIAARIASSPVAGRRFRSMTGITPDGLVSTNTPVQSAARVASLLRTGTGISLDRQRELVGKLLNGFDLDYLDAKNAETIKNLELKMFAEGADSKTIEEAVDTAMDNLLTPTKVFERTVEEVVAEVAVDVPTRLQQIAGTNPQAGALLSEMRSLAGRVARGEISESSAKQARKVLAKKAGSILGDKVSSGQMKRNMEELFAAQRRAREAAGRSYGLTEDGTTPFSQLNTNLWIPTPNGPVPMPGDLPRLISQLAESSGVVSRDFVGQLRNDARTRLNAWKVVHRNLGMDPTDAAALVTDAWRTSKVVNLAVGVRDIAESWLRMAMSGDSYASVWGTPLRRFANLLAGRNSRVNWENVAGENLFKQAVDRDFFSDTGMFNAYSMEQRTRLSTSSFETMKRPVRQANGTYRTPELATDPDAGRTFASYVRQKQERMLRDPIFQAMAKHNFDIGETFRYLTENEEGMRILQSRQARLSPGFAQFSPNLIDQNLAKLDGYLHTLKAEAFGGQGPAIYGPAGEVAPGNKFPALFFDEDMARGRITDPKTGEVLEYDNLEHSDRIDRILEQNHFEEMPPQIEFSVANTADSLKGEALGWKRTKNFLFRNFLSRPSHHLARSPALRNEVINSAKKILPMIEDPRAREALARRLSEDLGSSKWEEAALTSKLPEGQAVAFSNDIYGKELDEIFSQYTVDTPAGRRALDNALMQSQVVQDAREIILNSGFDTAADMVFAVPNKSAFATKYRSMQVFFDAATEGITALAELTRDNPGFFFRGERIARNAEEKFDAVYRTDEGQLAVRLPFVSQKSEIAIAGLVQDRAASMNPLGMFPSISSLSEEPGSPEQLRSFIPPHGPVPEIALSLAGFDGTALGEFVNPFGSNFNDPSDLLKVSKLAEEFLPGWLSKTTEAFVGARKEIPTAIWQTAMFRNMEVLNASGQYDIFSPTGREALVKQAEKNARNELLFRGLFQAIGPAAIRFETQIHTDVTPEEVSAIDGWNPEEDPTGVRHSLASIKDTYFDLVDHFDGDFDEASKAFQQMYSFDFNLINLKRQEFVDRGLQQDLKQAVDWMMDNEDAVIRHMGVAGYFAPQSGDFVEYAGSAFYEYAGRIGLSQDLTPEQSLELKAKSMQVNRYFNYLDNLDAQNPGETERKYYKNQVEAILSEEMPGWFSPVLGAEKNLSTMDFDERITRLAEAVKDPAFQDSELVPPLDNYLGIRSQVLDYVNQKGKRPKNQTILKDFTNPADMDEDEIQYLQDLGNYWAVRSPEFKRLWDNVLAAEFRQFDLGKGK